MLSWLMLLATPGLINVLGIRWSLGETPQFSDKLAELKLLPEIETDAAEFNYCAFDARSSCTLAKRAG